MLVLSRKVGERIVIGDDVEVTVVRLGPSRVRLGIVAPEGKRIIRSELLDQSPGDSGPGDRGQEPGEEAA